MSFRPERRRRHGRDTVPRGPGSRGRRRRRVRRGGRCAATRHARRVVVDALVRPVRGVRAGPPASLSHGVAGHGDRRARGRNVPAVPRRIAACTTTPTCPRSRVTPSCRRRAASRSRTTCLPRSRRSSGARSRPASERCGGPRASGRASVSRCSAAGAWDSRRCSGRRSRAPRRSSRWTSRTPSWSSRSNSAPRRVSAGGPERRRRPTRSATPRGAASTTRSKRPAGRRRCGPRSSRPGPAAPRS